VLASHSAEDTQALGRQLSRLLAPGDLLCLFGELGAGKTTFLQGLAGGLGVADDVTSPSFTLIHEHQGRLPFYHLDLYRLVSEELAEAGVEEALGAEAVVAVEWAERLPARLRRGALDIEIAFDPHDPEGREIRLRATGDRSARIVAELDGE
jgi:tRNA threonylcarbamoyladenosine biosynthesis protein TsaE